MRKRHPQRAAQRRRLNRLATEHSRHSLERLEPRLVLDSTVVFSEVMYHSKSGNAALEWVELHNEMAVNMDLSGWSLAGGATYTFASGSIMPAGGYLVIAASPAVLSAATGYSAGYGPFTGDLNTGGADLQLVNNTGRIMDEVDFGVGSEWPAAANGTGATLAKIDPEGASGTAESWAASTQVGGTPGAANFPAGPPAPSPVLNELAGATSGSFFVELANPSSSGVNVGGMQLIDLADPALPYTLPAQSLASGQYLTVTQAQLGFTVHAGDLFYLQSASGQSVFDAQTVSSSPTGRQTYGTGTWLIEDHATPAAANSFQLTSSVVINEIMYHHPAVQTAAAVTQSTTPIPLTSNWQYSASGVDLGTGWTATNYNDSSWSTGQAVFYAGSVPGGTPGNQNVAAITTLFSTGLNAAGQPVAAGSPDPHYQIVQSANGSPPPPNIAATVVTNHPAWAANDSTSQWISVVNPGTANIAVGTYSYQTTFDLTGFIPSTASLTMSLYADNSVTDVLLNGVSLKISAVGFASANGPYTVTTAFVPGINTLEYVTYNADGNGPNPGGFRATVSGTADPIPKNTQLPLGPNTYYFRNDFEFSGNPANTQLSLSALIGDGAVVYLNGIEVYRQNMPTGAPSYSTLASTPVNQPTLSTTIQLPSSALHTGLNTLAVEVHRSSAGDNSLGFGAELDALETISPATTYGSSPEEWLELYNDGTTAVDMSGWSLAGDIAYSFPQGTTLGAGKYLVIAKDAAYMQSLYPTLNVLGDYHHSLPSDGFVALEDANGNPADQVRYYSGGDWPSNADGGGSSLERVDPHADSMSASTWADSLNTGSQWQTYTYSAVAQTVVGVDRWSEFIMGLISAGEVLVDDVSVVQDPDGAATQLLQNGSFEGNTSSWRLLGNEDESHVIVDPTNPANHVLDLIATGPTESIINHVETTLAGGASVIDGKVYEISFRAKWISGSDQLNTHLYFDRVAQTTILKQTALDGTPGAPNSTYVGNIGPSYSNLAQSPVVPGAGQAVTVSTVIADPDGVASAQLWYRPDGGAWSNTPMTAGSGGRYSAVIPGQAAGTIMQFYVQSTDSKGAVSTWPAAGANARALYQVNNGAPVSSTIHNIRIIMTAADDAILQAPTNVMSDQDMLGTVVYDENQVFYNVDISLQGSERGRDDSSRVGFHVDFNPDDLFRGVQPTISLDRSGGYSGQGGKQDEIVLKQARNAAGGMPTDYDDLINIIAPQSANNGTSLLLMDRYGDDYLDSQYPDGSDGTVFKFELDYYPLSTTDGNPQSLKLPQPDDVWGTDIQYLGPNVENYRANYIIQNNRTQDDYSQIIALTNALSQSGAALDAASQATMDVPEWLRVFAMASLGGVGDTYTQGYPHNLQLYVNPSTDKIEALPWDWDFAWAQPTNAPLWGSGNFDNVVALPGNTRLFEGDLLDIITTTYNPTYMSQWTTGYGNLLGQNYSGILNYITQRGNFVLSQLPAQIPLSITTNGGLNFSTNQSSVTISGKAWINAESLQLAGSNQPLNITWTDPETWQATVPLHAGSNTLTFQGIGFEGQSVGTSSIQVTSTQGVLTDSLRVSELMYDPAAPASGSPYAADDFQYIELQNTGSQPLDLTGVQLSGGATFTFPSMSLPAGGYALLVRNPAAFASLYGAGASIAGTFTGTLSHSGAEMVLKDSHGSTIQDFTYSSSWYPITAGLGFSLVVTDPLADVSAWSLSSGWKPSGDLNGSPGAADTAPNPGTVVINEVLSNTTQARGQWIELANTGSAPVDVSLWYLSNSSTNLTQFQIPAGTVIPAGGFVTFTSTQDFDNPANPGALTPFALIPLGDSVFLSSHDPSGVAGGYRDSESFGDSDPEVSFGYYVKSTGGDDFVAMSSTTFDAANSPPQVGPIVFNELMYDPKSTGDEFIELYNNSSQAVPLYDPANPADTWQFTAGITFSFPQGAVIPAGGYAIVSPLTPGAFQAKYPLPAGTQVFGPYSGALDNSGESVTLSKPGVPQPGGGVPLIVEEHVKYSNSDPWPTSPHGSGPSLERISATSYGNDVVNWEARVNGGTPGLANDPLALSVADNSQLEGNSGSANLLFAVSLTQASAQTITVHYSTADGIATAGLDYTAVQGVLTFSPGTTSQTISVPILGDTLIESNETFYVNLSDASGADLQKLQGLGTIIDDDSPPAVVANTGLTVAPSSTTTIASGNLSYSSPLNSASQLTYSITSGPTHGTLQKGGAATTSFTQADINNGLITYVENGSVAASDSFNFTLSGAVGPSTSGSFAIGITALVLVNNVPTTVQVGSAIALGTSTLQATELGKTSSQLLYTIGTAPTGGTLTNTHTSTTLIAGSNFTQADIDSGFISYTNTNISAAADSFRFTVTDGGSGSTGLQTFSLTVSAPTVSLATATQSVNENGGTFTVTVNLSTTSAVATTIPFSLSGSATSGVNYNGVTASLLVIPAGQLSAAITGTLIDDGTYFPVNKTLIVTLGAPTGASLGAVSTDTVTIVENDSPPAVPIAGFTPGDLVVYRVGNATSPAGTSAATPLYLDEYTPAGVFVQSITLPSSTSTGLALTDSGKASSGGMLALSANGSQILVFGYNVSAGTASATSAASETAGIVGTDGSIQLERFVDEAGSNARSAVYDASTGRLYTSGGLGLFESTFSAGGTPTTTKIVNGSTGDVQIVGGVVFYAAGTSILSLGGEPTTATAGTTVVSDGSGNSPTQFFFARLGSGATFGTTGADTIYVADSKATNGTLFKFSWNGTAWTAGGSITGPDTASGNQLLGVTGTVSGTTGTIYFTEGNTGSATVGDVYRFSDTFGATISNVLSAPLRIVNVASLQNFRGIVLAPDDGVGSIGGLAGTTIYTVGATATAVGPGATFSDASNFMGGSLSVAITAGGAAADALGLAAGNNIAFTGTTSGTVSYGGNLIGSYTLTAGTTSTLTVTFNPLGTETIGNTAANPVSSAAIQALIRQVTFQTSVASGNRTVSFQVSENGGVSGAPATQTINVAVPTVTLATAAQTVNADGSSFNVTVNLSATSNVATTVPFTLSGTAANGVNYSNVTASPIVIPAGQTSATITGTLTNDGQFLTTSQQWYGYGGDAQHTADSTVASQPLQAIHWQTVIDAGYTSASGRYAHYGSPAITAGNTVIAPERVAGGGWTIQGINGATGSVLWTQPVSGYDNSSINYGWLPAYQPTIAGSGAATKVYYQGAGGSVLMRGNLDAPGAVTPTQIVLPGYNAGTAAAFNANVVINTPLTADAAGNVYFGYTVANPAAVGGLQSGIAEINALTQAVTIQTAYGAAQPASAPAMGVSTAVGGSTANLVYFAMANGDLMSFDTTNALALVHSVVVGGFNNLSTAAPTIGPDGNVYFGTLSPDPFYRGTSYQYSPNLTQTPFQAATHGGFGWDDTMSIVPLSMVPWYHPTDGSTYLLFSKYNGYTSAGGGPNYVALLDPNAQQPDQEGRGGFEMKVVAEIASPNGDEWCINSGVVDPQTDSILVNNEDGNLYRWYLGGSAAAASSPASLTQSVRLFDGSTSQPYTSTEIGPDGTVYASTQGQLLAVGALPPAAPSTTLIVTLGAPTNAQLGAITSDTITILASGPKVTTSSGADNYTIDSAAIAVDAAVTISDANPAPNLSATVSISGGFQAGDNLNVASQNGISGVYVPATGVLTLTGGGSSVANYQAALQSIAFSSTSTLAGTRTISFTISDGASASAAATKSIAVVPFQVSSFTPNSTGFVIGLNAVPNFSVLNLYSGSANGLGTPDMTVLNGSTAVQGSLVWDPSTMTATFVQTRGILAPGNYSVTLASRSDGWVDTKGNLLGGGSNYTANFTVTAPTTPILTLPDFARGPGQSVDVGDASTSYGTALSNLLPVALSNTTGVTSGSFELDYNANYLTVGSVQLAAGISGTLAVTNTTPGVLLVSITGFSSTATAGAIGGTDIVDISASVPAAAIVSYGASALLKIVNPQVNGAAIAATDSVEKVVYFGDANADGKLGSADASLVARNRVRLDNGFSAYPLTDPRIVGNVTGTGTLGSADASLIAQAGVRLSVPKIPTVPTHGKLNIVAVDPTVGIPLGIAAAPGQTVNVPISITDNASGVASADFEIDYDPALLTLTNAGVTLDSALSSDGWSLVTNVDNADGMAFVSLFATSGLPAGTPQLVNLAFTVAAGAPAGTTPITINPEGSDLGDEGGDPLPLSISNGSVAVALHPWQNTANQLDVDRSGTITPIDALDVIDYLNLHGPGALPPTFSGNIYLDVNGDDEISPIDALAIIDYLNLHGVTSAVSSAVASAVSAPFTATTPDQMSPQQKALEKPAQAQAATAVDAATNWAVSATSAGNSSVGSTSSIAASLTAAGPQWTTLGGSPTAAPPAKGSWGLNQAAVDSCFDGGRRRTDSTVHAAAADLVLADLPD